jgi:hypothetical protein
MFERGGAKALALAKSKPGSGKPEVKDRPRLA